MRARHVFVGLDIDNTIINHDASRESRIVWNGGGPAIWASCMLALKNTGKEKNIIVHFGIATAKPKYLSQQNALLNKRGDDLSQAVEEALHSIIEQDLIYFTNGQSKVWHALFLAQRVLSSKYNVPVNDFDIWIIDDAEGNIQDIHNWKVHARFYRAIHARDLCVQPIDVQKKLIASYFRNIGITLGVYREQQVIPYNFFAQRLGINEIQKFLLPGDEEIAREVVSTISSQTNVHSNITSQPNLFPSLSLVAERKKLIPEEEEALLTYFKENAGKEQSSVSCSR